MADYKESTVSGSEYVRCSEITISNPLGQTPLVQFVFDRVTNLSDKQIMQREGTVSVPFDPAKVYDLLDPETLDSTGETVSGGALYQALFSAALDAAKGKWPEDVEESEETPIEPEPEPEQPWSST